MKLNLDQLETRILSILKERYPITVEELRDELSIRPDTLSRSLKALSVKGLIVLEPLPDKTYIRLLVPDIQLEGGKSGTYRPEESYEDRTDDDSFAYM